MCGGDDEEEAFQTLKLKLCSAPILSLPEGSEDFVVYCDASLKGFGAVLMQREKDYMRTPTRQLRRMKKTHTTLIGLGAWIFALRLWRHYLYGTKCTANVVADALSRKDKEPIRVRGLCKCMTSAKVNAAHQKPQDYFSNRKFLFGNGRELQRISFKQLPRTPLRYDSICGHLARGAVVDYFCTETLASHQGLWRSLQKSMGTNFRYEHCHTILKLMSSERNDTDMEDIIDVLASLTCMAGIEALTFG
ncbi:putative reverse transcriptase domain-containing protein [Tanacetum coccineum]